MVAAAVVLRERRGELQILLVKTSDGRHYVLPKGHREPGESAVATARRETEEESGWRPLGLGRLVEPFSWKGEQTAVVVFDECRLVGQGEREAAWLPIEAGVLALRVARSRGEAEPMVEAVWAAVRGQRSVEQGEGRVTTGQEAEVAAGEQERKQPPPG